MSKEMSLIALGLWVVVVPYLGVPGSWRTTILLFSGLLIAALAFLLRAESLVRSGKRSAHHPFVENIPDEKETPWHPQDRHHDHEGINSLN
jgi:hypothetical protein